MNVKRVITVVVGGLLLLIFLSLMFTYQVRTTEIALVSSWFGPDRIIYGSADTARSGVAASPGINLRLPWPFQTVHKLDGRTHLFESNYDQVGGDGDTLLMQVYAGWRVGNAEKFRSVHQGAGTSGEEMMRLAEVNLAGMINRVRQAQAGRYKITSFLGEANGTDAYRQFEGELEQGLKDLKPDDAYGIEVVFVGIKRVGIPRTVAQSVIQAIIVTKREEVEMVNEKAMALSKSIIQRAEAEARGLLAAADDNATKVIKAAEGQVQEDFAAMERKNPELAILLKKIKSIEALRNSPTTLILTDQNPLLEILGGLPKELKMPVSSKPSQP